MSTYGYKVFVRHEHNVLRNLGENRVPFLVHIWVKSITKNLFDKDFAELSGQFSGMICVKALVYLSSTLGLFRTLLWRC